MIVIVGLGNPGKEYENTRHNVGFNIIDLISKKYNIELNRRKFNGIYGYGNIFNRKVLLLKPMTYMNLSGESLKQVLDFYKIPNENIIAIYDDISLDIGRLRIREKGSAGGHNGIKSIISNIGTDVFTRIKVGVGQPFNSDLVSHVLGRFSKEDREMLEKTFQVVADSVEVIIKDGAKEAMNKFNGLHIE